jgi:hypothetical protein
LQLPEEKHLHDRWRIIDDFAFDILTMTSATMWIVKFTGSNYKQWPEEMPLPLEQKQVNGIVMG